MQSVGFFWQRCRNYLIRTPELYTTKDTTICPRHPRHASPYVTVTPSSWQP